MPYSTERSDVEIKESVEDGVRREGEGRIVVMYHGSAVVPILHILVKVQQTVAAQRCVALEAQPGSDIDPRGNLRPQPVGIRDIGGEGFAYVAELSCLHQLVGILHII